MQAEEVRADLSERGDTSLDGCGVRELRAHAESCDVRNKTSLCQNEQWPSEGVGSEAKRQSEFHTVRDAAPAATVEQAKCDRCQQDNSVRKKPESLTELHIIVIR